MRDHQLGFPPVLEIFPSDYKPQKTTPKVAVTVVQCKTPGPYFGRNYRPDERHLLSDMDKNALNPRPPAKSKIITKGSIPKTIIDRQFIREEDELFAEELCTVLENEKIWYDWWHRSGYLQHYPMRVMNMKRFLELRVPSMKDEVHRVTPRVMDILWAYFKERYAETVKSRNGTL